MASGRFSKQAAPYLSMGRFLNSANATGDTVVGGTVTAAPSGLTVSQFDQNLPGDRFILSPADALAYSNNNVGNLYTGTYRYVATRNNSTSIPQRGRAAFWDLTALGANNIGSPLTDGQYQVTSDEAANIGVVLMAGVFINNIGAGNYWFIQESGKASCWFKGNNGSVLYGGANMTGTPAIGCGVYLAAVGSNTNNNCGLFDVLVAGNTGVVFASNNTTGYTAIDQMITRYTGVAETVPTNGNITLVDIPFWRGGFRW
jgi:hypothetical protein